MHRILSSVEGNPDAILSLNCAFFAVYEKYFYLIDGTL